MRGDIPKSVRGGGRPGEGPVRERLPALQEGDQGGNREDQEQDRIQTGGGGRGHRKAEATTMAARDSLLQRRRAGDVLLAGYSILLEKSRISEAQAPIAERSGTKLVFHSMNPVLTLGGCGRPRATTRRIVCRHLTEKGDGHLGQGRVSREVCPQLRRFLHYALLRRIDRTGLARAAARCRGTPLVWWRLASPSTPPLPLQATIGLFQCPLPLGLGSRPRAARRLVDATPPPS